MPDYTNFLGLYKPSRNDNLAMDTTLADNFSNIDSKLGSALTKNGGSYNSIKDRFEEIEEKVKHIVSINVKFFGAVGDGATDDTLAFIEAVEYAKTLGGATIRIPKGDYLINGRMELYSNITFVADRGTTMRKGLNATTAHIFVVGLKNGTTGYGGGAKNLGFYNINFQGLAVDENIYSALANTFNHAQNVIFKNCYFKDCITRAHAIDMGGCDNILIDGCIFSGAYDFISRGYTEAIQIDSSTELALGDPEFTNYDSLPTKNVMVKDCKFIPSYNNNGTVKNYAPNPIGNHGFTGGKYYENIVFENNFILDGWEQQDGNWRAWIHFYGLKNSDFNNNTFINTRGVKCSPFGFYSSDSGRYNPDTGVSESGEPLPCRDLNVNNNLIVGFSSINSPALIRAYGFNYNSQDYNTVNINIKDNQFTDSGSSNLIQINKFSDVAIEGNKAYFGSRLASIYNGFNLSITNNITTAMSTGAFFIDEVEVVNIQGNIGGDLKRPLEVTECKKITINNNNFDNIHQTGTDDFANKFRNLEKCIIQSNLFNTTEAISYGLYVYDTNSTSSDINVYDNMAIGFTNDVNKTGIISNYNYRA